MKNYFSKISYKKIITLTIFAITILMSSCKIPSKVQLYKITFDTDGGSEVPFQKIYEGTKVSPVRNPVKQNYGFDGWYLNGEKFDFNTKIYEDITLKAQWKWLYSVTLDTDKGQNLADLKIKEGYPTDKLPTPKKAGRIFKGWFTDKNFETLYNETLPVTEDFTIYAKWETQTFANPYKFNDGTFVETPSQWQARAEELSQDYQDLMYGQWRTGETVEYEILPTTKKVEDEEGNETEVDDPLNKIIELTITRPDTKKSISYNAKVTLPDSAKCTMPEGGWPFVLGVSTGVSEKIALENGYAFVVPSIMGTITWDGNTFPWDIGVTGIAEDNINHKGLFYDLYPYNKNDPKSQTGELMAWGWGLSKIIDALYNGAAAELNINKENSIVTGVSRYGKAAAVCGTFERRIKMVAPGCSGAGGMASYRYFSEDMTYDLSSVGASVNHVWGANEPLGSLTSDSEGGWFNDKFRSFKNPTDFELDQYMLAAINADPNRYFVILGAASNTDDWVNAPSMYLTYRAAETIYKFLGLEDHIYCYFHNNGHAVTEDDMKYLIDLFNDKVYGNKTNIAEFDYETALRTSVFEEAANYDPLFDTIDKQWDHPVDNERNHDAKLKDIRSGSAPLYK